MRHLTLFCCVICLLGSTATFAAKNPPLSADLSGGMSFSVFSGFWAQEHFTVSTPEISQSLKLHYQILTDSYLVEINASSQGIFGASPYVNLPDIRYNFSIDEAFLGIRTGYGTLMIGRYAPLMPVSADDYRTDGLLFGNPSLTVDAISLYNDTSDIEYEYVLAYLNYSRKSNAHASSADLLIVTRFNFNYSFPFLKIAFSPGILISDLGKSFGLCLPFFAEQKGHVVEGEIALYNLLGTTLLDEGLYPGIILRYYPKNSSFVIEIADIAQNFLPYLGNFANFGGLSNWSTGSSGIKLSLLKKSYTCSFKFEKMQPKTQVYVLTWEQKDLPGLFSPLKIDLGLWDRQAFFNIQTGLTFHF